MDQNSYAEFGLRAGVEKEFHLTIILVFDLLVSKNQSVNERNLEATEYLFYELLPDIGMP